MRGVIRGTDHLIAGPAVEPLSLDLTKAQRRMPRGASSMDALFDLWIAAARQHFEEQTGRQIITATWEYWLTGFPAQGGIELPHPPLQSIVSITYDDSNGDEQTIDSDDYAVVAPAGDYCSRGRVMLAGGSSWPTSTWTTGESDLRRNGVRIRYKAGYGDSPTDVPALIQASLLFLVGHFHKYGEEVQDSTGTLERLPIGAKLMMDGFKYSALPQLSPSIYAETSWPD